MIGRYELLAYVNGFINSAQASFGFEMPDAAASAAACSTHPRHALPSPLDDWPTPSTNQVNLRFSIFQEVGTSHVVKWHNQDACLAPKPASEPFLVKDTETDWSFYADVSWTSQDRTFSVEGKNGDLCIPQSELRMNELYKATIFANDSTSIASRTHKITLMQEVTVKLSIG
ncbi:unnamed protein product [Mesocestoides corti]|uniref:Uncharacterized protein n=2 Tax=Mesocestoides corti TaxID=53468 RepID=A0A0R3U4F7_MESCO|nr:unnamed protein product [Mesocestoides corti]